MANLGGYAVTRGARPRASRLKPKGPGLIDTIKSVSREMKQAAGLEKEQKVKEEHRLTFEQQVAIAKRVNYEKVKKTAEQIALKRARGEQLTQQETQIEQELVTHGWNEFMRSVYQNAHSKPKT